MQITWTKNNHCVLILKSLNNRLELIIENDVQYTVYDNRSFKGRSSC